MRVNVSSRRQNSGRQHDGKRFPSHLAWLRKRPCLIAEKHVCSGKIEAHHVNEAGGKGMGLKVADFEAVPLCSMAHGILHANGNKRWQEHFGVNLIEAAKAYAKASPHRHLWEASRV